MKRFNKIWVIVPLLVVFLAGHAHCDICPDTTAPTVNSTNPASDATDVAINQKIAVTFSEAMDRSTITGSTFKLTLGITPVSGKVVYRSAGLNAIFTPSIDLEPNTEYTATITTGVKDLVGNALAVDKVWSFTTGAAADTTAPTVNSTNPVSDATNVAINQKIAVTFSEAMDPSKITRRTFKLTHGTTDVLGNVTCAGVTGEFTPGRTLLANTEYTATITTGAKDLAGNALAVEEVWSFTTGAAADTTAPTVKSTSPANDATGVGINQKIAATFSDAMKPSTITTATFTLTQGTTPVSGEVTYFDRTGIFTPSSDLAPNAEYTVRIGTMAEDRAGNALAVDKVWSFTTGAAADTTAPTVNHTSPASGATDVAISRRIAVTFSERMDPLTITRRTFKLAQGTTPVSGRVTYAVIPRKFIFTPESRLLANTVYTATITTGAKDLAGNALAVDKVWSFTTGEMTVRLPVDLGLAGTYAILAKSGISTTPGTLITGDIGVSPIAANAITGFGLTLDASNQFATSPLVVGKVYAADYAPPTPTNLSTAISNMETAYADAAGRTLPDATELGAGEIGGMTIAPGLYKWSSGVLVTTNVTLKGCPEDVWIFQIDGDLTVAGGKSVILEGGAQAKNIFWQVAGGAGVKIGTTAQMEGIILALNAIVVDTGASWNGRALAQKAVTLDANAITEPD
jgi:methionine-rich copper-binding protein CopC